MYFKFENFQNFDKSYEKENKEYEEKYQAALHGKSLLYKHLILYQHIYCPLDKFCLVWIKFYPDDEYSHQ